MPRASAPTGTGTFNAANYLVSYTSFSGTVGLANLTIKATGPGKIYGTAIPTQATGLNFQTSGTFPGETVTSVTLTADGPGASASTRVGAAFSVTPTAATGTGGFLTSSYTKVTYVPYLDTVAAAPLILTATGPSKTYGTALTTGSSTSMRRCTS